jgi:hypothetical protein
MGSRPGRRPPPEGSSGAGPGDELHRGEPVAEKFALRPAVGAVEPAGAAGGGHTDTPPKVAYAVTSPPQGCRSKVPVRSGSPHRWNTLSRSRPWSSITRAKATSWLSARQRAVRWWSSAADQSTPKRGSNAVGTHIASPATRPAALRDRSGPSARMTGSSPRSRQRIWPCRLRSSQSR